MERLLYWEINSSLPGSLYNRTGFSPNITKYISNYVTRSYHINTTTHMYSTCSYITTCLTIFLWKIYNGIYSISLPQYIKYTYVKLSVKFLMKMLFYLIQCRFHDTLRSYRKLKCRKVIEMYTRTQTAQQKHTNTSTQAHAHQHKHAIYCTYIPTITNEHGIKPFYGISY